MAYTVGQHGPGSGPHSPAPRPAPRPYVLPPAVRAATQGVAHVGAVAQQVRSGVPKQVLTHTFDNLPSHSQAAVIRGAIRSTSAEARMIVDHVVKGLRGGSAFDVHPFKMPNLGSISGPTNIGVQAARNSLIPKDTVNVGQLVSKVAHAGVGSYGGKGTHVGGPGSVLFGGQKGALHIAKAAVTDVATLPENTVQAAAGVAQQLAGQHFGNALHMLIDPYVSTFTHLPNAFYNHPVNTALMVGGPEAALGRAGGAIARSGALGRAAKAAGSTARAPLRLGPDIAGAPIPLIEHRSYSPNLITKGVQVAREKRLQARGIDPNVSRPKPAIIPSAIANSLNIGLDAKTRRIADEMTGVRQMAGRESRSAAIHAVQTVKPKDKAARGIVAHIMQGVIRTPETAIADITHEINRLKAAQTGRRTAATVANRTQIRDLSLALQHPEVLPQAFHAADTLRNWFNARDAYMVKQGVLDPEQALRSKLFPYAIAHMGAKYDHGLGQLADHAGNPLPTQTILDHIAGEHNGLRVPDPAYVGHYPNKGGFWNFYQAYKAARGSKGGARRTGEAFRQGNYDHSYNALTAQAARTEEAVTKAGLHDRIVNRLGIGKSSTLIDSNNRHENGLWTPREARRFAHAAMHDDHGNPIPGAQPLVPITAAPSSALSAVRDIQHPSELQHVDGLELQALDRAVNDAASRNDGLRNVVLVPQAALDQFKAQFASKPGGLRKLGQVTQQFRRTVLPYSTHWMTQIASEAVLRSVVAGVLDPRNVVAGRQLMRRLKATEEGRNTLREMVNATFYNRHDPLAIHNPNQSPIMAGIKRSPAGLLIHAHNLYANSIGHAMGSLEHEFRVMGLGKFARQQVQEFTGSYQAGIGLQAKNLAMMVDKLKTDPALVARMGRQIEDVFGKYNKLSPKIRGAVQSAVPFLPWYLNAAKFVLWNLPVKHPVASSLLASLRQTINQDIQDGKQLPLNEFQVEALARFTPFGLIRPHPTFGSLIADAANPILPQASSAWNVLHGQNVFGDQPLKGPNGKVKSESSQAAGLAFQALLESLLPAARQARLVAEGGKTSYGTSTLLNPQPKPGASGGILDRIFNPLHAFEAAGKYGGSSSGGSSSGSEWGGGGSSGSGSGGGSSSSGWG